MRGEIRRLREQATAGEGEREANRERGEGGGAASGLVKVHR